MGVQNIVVATEDYKNGRNGMAKEIMKLISGYKFLTDKQKAVVCKDINDLLVVTEIDVPNFRRGEKE